MTTNKEQHRSWISRILQRATAALAFAVALISSAQAQTETVLFTFTGGATGFQPYTGLVQDAKGNLYGTASGGGGGSIFCTFTLGIPGCGVVFKLGPAGKQTVLHSFTGGSDGAAPFYGSNLTIDAHGNIYGATQLGGLVFLGGNGVVLKIDPTGNETVLYAFPNGPGGALRGPAGADPNGGLLVDRAGNVYGTTQLGGLNACGSVGCGVVFKVDPTGNETVLYSFKGGTTDGNTPNCCLVRDAAGNLYGTTSSGGSSGQGTVFKLSPSGQETLLYSFMGGTDGANPSQARLLRDSHGIFYGTTSSGGSFGAGTVFKLSPSGTETVLYTFTGGADGGFPSGLVRDTAGNFYGAAGFGGTNSSGVVFKVDTTSKETVLYNFTGGADGGFPIGNLVLDSQENLYGVANSGGQTCNGYPFGCGVVFKLALK